MLVLSLALAALVIINSLTALLTPGFYSLETENWQAQTIGQDIVDLFFIAPCLIISSIVAHKNSRRASMFRAGVLLYLTYTYVLYCFDVHFNKLFILYCITLGLSFYAFLFFLLFHLKNTLDVEKHFRNNSAIRFTGIYFVTVAILFYLLWLAEIIPAVFQNTRPESLVETGLVTNGVQVIDLAVFLPGVFIAGMLLLKKLSAGLVLAPIILSFFILMDVTIAALNVIMNVKQVESNVGVSVIMSFLALTSVLLFIWFFKQPDTAGDLGS